MESTVFGCLSRRSRAGLTALAAAFAIAIAVAGCATSAPQAPYPAFVQADTLPDLFMADLPGVRAKRFAGDPKTRRSSNRLDLPRDWSFATGGLPNKSTEIYVLAGTVKLGEFTLEPGSYAYLPDGATGVPMSTDAGAQVLYFLDDANSAAVIRTPLISSSDLIPWNPLSADPEDAGVSIKELRHDPGSGAKTFLLRIEAGATRPWESLSILEEGYLLDGEYRHSECVDGVAVSGDYARGGYFYRPADSVNGGPESSARQTAVWFVRWLGPGQRAVHAECRAEAAAAPTS